MSDHPETLAAILAEMRDFADHRASDAGGERPGIELLRSYADRIEAAAKRELSRAADDAASRATLDRTAKDAAEYMAYATAHKSSPQSGAAAAMREALENVERVARFCAEMPQHTPGYPTDTARADVLYSRIAELGRVARAALAAPARNCDACRTLEDAAFAYANRKTTGLRFSSFADFERWIFAPAEGGGHA